MDNIESHRNIQIWTVPPTRNEVIIAINAMKWSKAPTSTEFKIFPNEWKKG